MKLKKVKLQNAIKEATLNRKEQDLRNYAKAFLEAHKNANNYNNEIENHYHWLLNRTDWLNPLIIKTDELLLEEMKKEFV